MGGSPGDSGFKRLPSPAGLGCMSWYRVPAEGADEGPSKGYGRFVAVMSSGLGVVRTLDVRIRVAGVLGLIIDAYVAWHWFNGRPGNNQSCRVILSFLYVRRTSRKWEVIPIRLWKRPNKRNKGLGRNVCSSDNLGEKFDL